MSGRQQALNILKYEYGWLVIGHNPEIFAIQKMTLVVLEIWIG
jgi:hypothetical protein